MGKLLEAARQLDEAITKLQRERQAYADRIAAIDEAFRRLGIQPQERKRRGRPPGRSPAASAVPKPRRRGRGTFGKSGLESVLDFIKGNGKSGVTTGEVNAHWKSEGRGGNAYKTLGELVDAGKLKRQNLKGERGSRYTAA